MEESGRKSRLTSLPAGCVTEIISRTSPPDASRLSLVSTDLLLAADSDAVWESFLPKDYQSIIAGAAESSQPEVHSKKELYLRLSDKPILIESGRKSFWLDKESGKKCYMLAGRDLTIVWSGIPLYWTWNSLPQSRFTEVANLKIVWWLEIKGKMNTRMLSPRTNYAVYLVFQRNDTFHGFEGNPIESSIGVVGGQTAKQVTYLDPEHDTSPIWTRIDGWYEVELGEFFNEGREDEELEMSIMEVKSGNPKYGLLIEGIEIRPKFCS